MVKLQVLSLKEYCIKYSGKFHREVPQTACVDIKEYAKSGGLLNNGYEMDRPYDYMRLVDKLYKAGCKGIYVAHISCPDPRPHRDVNEFGSSTLLIVDPTLKAMAALAGEEAQVSKLSGKVWVVDW